VKQGLELIVQISMFPYSCKVTNSNQLEQLCPTQMAKNYVSILTRAYTEWSVNEGRKMDGLFWS